MRTRTVLLGVMLAFAAACGGADAPAGDDQAPPGAAFRAVPDEIGGVDATELVQTIGTKGESGADDAHFHRPTFMTFLPDGSMFVADGYNGNRVVKLDRDGAFVAAWGEPSGRGGHHPRRPVRRVGDRGPGVQDREVGFRRPPAVRLGNPRRDARHVPEPHGASVDQEGNLYVAEVGNGRAQKFRPRPGANPAFLVGSPVYAAWQ